MLKIIIFGPEVTKPNPINRIVLYACSVNIGGSVAIEFIDSTGLNHIMFAHVALNTVRAGACVNRFLSGGKTDSTVNSVVCCQ